MFDTLVTVVGNLVAEPRFTITKDGHAVSSFRVAATSRRFDRSTAEWRDGDTLFANVTCWRGLAENVMASLKKGSSVIVYGRLSVRPYETKDGDKRQSVDIDAMAIGPELGRVVTVVKRAERGVPLAQVDSVVGAGMGGDLADASPVGAAPTEAAQAAGGGGADWAGWSAAPATAEPDAGDPDDEFSATEIAVGVELGQTDAPFSSDDSAPPDPVAAPAQLAGSGGRWRSRGAGG
jgi:single-strand DNA-binding protein